MLGKGYLLMPRPASFAMIVLLPLFSHFCFCEQPTVVSTAAMSGLRDSVKSVFTEVFTYEITVRRDRVFLNALSTTGRVMKRRGTNMTLVACARRRYTRGVTDIW